VPGHPRHQKRQLSVKVRGSRGAKQMIAVEAQTEHDAIFRPGMTLAARLIAGHAECNPEQRTVNGVQDPAPRTVTAENLQ
jgi:hypothetical protein